MKKLLITGGVLFSVLPAMALDLPTLYQTNATDGCDDTTSVAFQNSPVTMQAVYVANACDPTEYLAVTGSEPTIDNNGNLTNASCVSCTAGNYCEGLSDITITNNQLASSYGLTECPAGTYCAAGVSNYTACTGATYASTAGSSSCTNVTSGYYADKTNPATDLGNTTQTQCPVGYRDAAAANEAACSKTVDATYCAAKYPSSNFNHVATSGNNAYSVAVNSNNASIVNNAVAYGSRNFDPLCSVSFGCETGYTTTNLYSWLADNVDKLASNPAYCSPDGTGTGCTTMERGTTTWTITGAGSPVSELHFVSVCTNTEIGTGTSSMLLPQSTANFSASNTGAFCWVRNIDFPGQPWLLTGGYLSNNNELSPETCAQRCGDMVEFGFGQNINELNEIIAGIFTEMATLTPGGQGNPSADVCIASTVTINWGGAESNTCTYGETFTAPSTAPTAAEGYKFIGWKVSAASNNNND